MRATRVLGLLVSILLLAETAAAEDKDLLSLATDLGAVLQWDALRDAGVLSFGEDRIALGVGASMALINYRLKVEIDPPVRRDGAVWLTTAAVSVLSDAVQRDRLAHAAEHMRVSYVVIDPGHGGKDPGAIGSFTKEGKKVTVQEKDVTLKIALQLAAMIRSGYPDKQVTLTRSDDTFVDVDARPQMANALLEKTSDTVLYVSIHVNGSLNKTKPPTGFEVWYLPPSYSRNLLTEKSVGKDKVDILPILNSMFEDEISLETMILANGILSGLDAAVGNLTQNRGLWKNDWAVVRNARMPAVLVEVGFVASPEEAARLADDSYLKRLAEGLYNGVGSFIAQFEQNGGAGAR